VGRDRPHGRARAARARGRARVNAAVDGAGGWDVEDSLVVDVVDHPLGTAPDGRALDTAWTSVAFDIVLEPAS